MDASTARAATLLEAARPRLNALPGVVATGVGLEGGRPVIQVFVESRDSSIEDVPRDIDGIEVQVLVSGPLQLLDHTD